MIASAFHSMLMSMGQQASTLLERGVSRQEALDTICVNWSIANKERSGVYQNAPSFALAWSECGFATVEPGHRLVASLIATSIPDEHLDSLVRLPWRCFAVRVPSGVVCDSDVSMLVLRARDGRYKMMTSFDDGVAVSDEPDLISWSRRNHKTVTPQDGITIDTDRASRLLGAVGQLFLGVCAELSTHRQSAVQETGTHRSKRKQKTPSSYACIKLTRPVIIDVRGAVRRFVEGGGASPTVQILVRGHWKSQPCGSLMQDRKLIHIEPYWRGPEDSPIAVRPHQFSEGS